MPAVPWKETPKPLSTTIWAEKPFTVPHHHSLIGLFTEVWAINRTAFLGLYVTQIPFPIPIRY